VLVDVVSGADDLFDCTYAKVSDTVNSMATTNSVESFANPILKTLTQHTIA
jgi:hypothetical protein